MESVPRQGWHVPPQGWHAERDTRQQGALASSNAVLCMQAMEYMVNCKYTQAAEKSGHPVESHCVILVSLQSPQRLHSCALSCLCWHSQAVSS